ncbi:unnamed protein product [Cylicostephanus goldi]|uniref:Uncharacterized protein n=1 Tax=Cylicostephanus goldi TaxID=71465 RepID=A0A3P6RGZ1_CYLGO|nr:unnamed protein product [Cylicostephanus goldi]
MSETTTAMELFPGEAKTVSSTSTALYGQTNAIYEIGASPSQGTLLKGAKAEIIVVLNADVPDVPDAVRHSDKVGACQVQDALP